MDNGKKYYFKKENMAKRYKDFNFYKHYLL